MRLVGCLGAASRGRFFLPRNRRVTANLASRAAKILTFETLRPLISNTVDFRDSMPQPGFCELPHIEIKQESPGFEMR